MDAERWKLIGKVYHEVLAFPVPKRAAMLESLCSEDSGLRREVESLLDAREQAGRFLSSRDLEADLAELASDPNLAGQRLGVYDLLAALGSGAMGEFTWPGTRAWNGTSR